MYAQVRLIAPATADEVGPLRRAAARVAAEQGLAGQALERLELGVSEALSNVVRHAYPKPQAPGTMTLEVAADERDISVTVSDAGRGMDSRSDGDGLGLGLGIIADVADRFEIDSDAGIGTVVTLIFTR
jgi:anti-sigma regulatory factor (Ser/Thr protein kinase)